MPIYKVKPEKNSTDAPAMVGEGSKKKRYPTVYMPVSKEILDALELDGPVTVTLTGTVRGLRSSQDQYKPEGSNELTVEIRQVEAYPTEKDEEAAEEETPEETMGDAIDKGLGYAKKEEAAAD